MVVRRIFVGIDLASLGRRLIGAEPPVRCALGAARLNSRASRLIVAIGRRTSAIAVGRSVLRGDDNAVASEGVDTDLSIGAEEHVAIRRKLLRHGRSSPSCTHG